MKRNRLLLPVAISEMEKIGKQATGWKQFPREILLCFIIGNGGLYHKNERKNKIG